MILFFSLYLFAPSLAASFYVSIKILIMLLVHKMSLAAYNLFHVSLHFSHLSHIPLHNNHFLSLYIEMQFT